MALIKCSECGHDVSSRAKACPNCGDPIVEDKPKPPTLEEQLITMKNKAKDLPLDSRERRELKAEIEKTEYAIKTGESYLPREYQEKTVKGLGVSYLMAFLVPPIGTVLSIYLLCKGEIGHFIGVFLLSDFMLFLLYVLFLN